MQQNPEEGEGGSGVGPLDEGEDRVKGEAVRKHHRLRKSQE